MFEKITKTTKSYCCVGFIILWIVVIIARVIQGISISDLVVAIGFLIAFFVIGGLFGFFDSVIWKRPETQEKIVHTEQKLKELDYEGIPTDQIRDKLKNSKKKWDLNDLTVASKETENLNSNWNNYNLLFTRFNQLLEQNKDVVKEMLSEDVIKISNKFDHVRADLTMAGIKDIEHDITLFINKLDEINKYRQEGYK